MNNADDLPVQFTELLLSQNLELVIDRTREILDKGISAVDFFQKIFTPAMEKVGEKFSLLEIFLPELIGAADIASIVNERVIYPKIQIERPSMVNKRGTVLIASVKGDCHDIGKNMVALMLEVNGFNVIDTGVDVSPREIIDRAKEVKADIIALSSLLTTCMPYMREVVELLDGFGLRKQFNVIVGGAPITAKFSESIGADAYGSNAVEGVQRCIRLMGQKMPNQTREPEDIK